MKLKTTVTNLFLLIFIASSIGGIVGNGLVSQKDPTKGLGQKVVDLYHAQKFCSIEYIETYFKS